MNAHTKKTVIIVGASVGGVCLAGGATWYFINKSKKKHSTNIVAKESNQVLIEDQIAEEPENDADILEHEIEGIEDLWGKIQDIADEKEQIVFDYNEMDGHSDEVHDRQRMLINRCDQALKCKLKDKTWRLNPDFQEAFDNEPVYLKDANNIWNKWIEDVVMPQQSFGSEVDYWIAKAIENFTDINDILDHAYLTEHDEENLEEYKIDLMMYIANAYDAYYKYKGLCSRREEIKTQYADISEKLSECTIKKLALYKGYLNGSLIKKSLAEFAKLDEEAKDFEDAPKFVEQYDERMESEIELIRSLDRAVGRYIRMVDIRIKLMNEMKETPIDA